MFITQAYLHILSFRYWIDETSAHKLDQRIQKLLFIFACTNSCVNPMIYGFFHIKARGRSNPDPPRVVIVENNFRLERIHE